MSEGLSSSRGGFSVAWEQYNSTICSGLQGLQQRSEFVDMTIAADGHLVRVHQLVIGLASPYLKELICSAPTPHPIIFLNNVSHSILCCILEYIYTGEALVPAEDLKTFVATGKALHVRGLDEMTFQENISRKSSKQNTKHASPDVVEAATTLEHISTGQVSQANTPGIFVKTLSSRNIIPSPTNKTPMKRPHATTSGLVRDMPDIAPTSPKINKLESTVEYLDENMDELKNVEDMYTQHEELIEDSIEDATDPDEDTFSPNADSEVNTTKPEIMYTMSNMGGIQLILNRFLYRMRNKYKDGRRRWECVNYNLTKCTAMAITLDNTLISRHSFHNHQFHDKKIMSKVKNGLVYTSIKKMPPSIHI